MIEDLKVRKHVLEEKDPIGNQNIINKLNRQIRKLEKESQE